MALPDCSGWEFSLWLLRRRRRWRVEGRSMLPLLEPGDEVLVNPRAYQQRSPQVGDIAIVQHPHRPALQMVKRVGEILPTPTGAEFWIYGDNPGESTDSRQFGPVARSHLLGRITCHFR
ncbi:nickel-type superoxide dismutase maturation protease [Spirulina major]|uniref:nickel-type superoxide dismutase maturation protease n=1 Tax=Spirulina major TaxID=270636 RepID=UPI000933EBF0|nr:nickel-type superoxide dismutase maturation protease [Spirulina major]